ncbi:hypothetical protein H6503_04495 [Candidatus Woesearchaeota archaeon]|nr:hypothetical protein [Candidatus Woesearchaeota archaeon]
MSIRIISSRSPPPRLHLVFILTFQVITALILLTYIFSIVGNNFGKGVEIKKQLSEGMQIANTDLKELEKVSALQNNPSSQVLTYWIRMTDSFARVYPEPELISPMNEIVVCEGEACNVKKQELLELSYKNESFLVMIPEDLPDGNYFLSFTCNESGCKRYE